MEPQFGDDKPFDAIVSNPPYSVKWAGSDNPTLINDERFAPRRRACTKIQSGFCLYFTRIKLSFRQKAGRRLSPSQAFFIVAVRSKKIRQYLVDNNFVETVIALAPNLFYGTSIAVNILVLSKHKPNTQTQFIDASGLFKSATNNNILEEEHIEQILKLFANKEDVPHLAKSVSFEEIAQNDHNLAVSSYVEQKRYPRSN